MPEYIVIVVEKAYADNIICATFATSEQEAKEIASRYQDGYFYEVKIVLCDYSMRNE